MLGGRGPAGVEKLLGGLGGGLQKLVDPFDPLIGKGTVTASSAGAGAVGSAVSTATRPSTVKGVRVTGVSIAHTDPTFLNGVLAAAKAAGATVIDVVSATRPPATNAAAGGVPNSNHLPDSSGLSHALDGRAYIPGRGWVPLGLLPTLGRFGIRSGNQPGFYHGAPDPSHVDDAHNQGR
jgi:hypothetical protein